MRIWSAELIPHLCRQHLLAVWRESLGAYKIITEGKKGYRNHPAVKEFETYEGLLWNRLLAIRNEMLKRGYHPKDMPEVKFSWIDGIKTKGYKEWQDFYTQKYILQNKNCNCRIGKKLKGKLIKCVSCGKEKYFRPSHDNKFVKHFCSKVCSQKYKKMEKHPKYKHGMKDTRFYRIWVNMRSRCKYFNRDNSKWYIAKGIKVCDEWMDFSIFKDDMYESYIEHCKQFAEKNTTIDRINPRGNYSKINCRWATWKEQQKNKSLEQQIAILKQKGCDCKV